MEKTIVIDGKSVKFKATAATLRIYRMKFQRDLMVDLAKLTMGLKANNNNFNIIDLEVFENVAYVMAKQADPTIPDTADEWLDGFETFAIRDILPGILSLWSGNMHRVNPSKKKRKKKKKESQAQH